MSISSMQRRARMTLVVLAGVLLAACGSQISIDNYNKLKTGQSYDEVKAILGEPARCDEMLGVRSCLWGEEQRGISVNFLAGQVVLLSAHNLK